ncbi:MAG TPA: nuclear transport factor 2 family protein [Longimicrobiales bacterium]
MRRATTALLLLATLTACRIERTPRAGLADPTGVARAEINAMLLGFREAMLAGDARRVAAFFTAGARLYLPDTPDIRSRGDIDGAYAAAFDSARIVDIEVQSDDIDVLAEIAYQIGSFRQRLIRNDTTEERAGRFVIRWVRGPETTWQIERMLVNQYPVDSATVAPD